VSASGAKLKEAREAKSLSLDDVASATRINKKYLQAIEEDRAIDLPEVFRKAFVKDYSEYLGIELEAVEGQPAPEPKVEQGRIASTVTSQVVTTNLPGSTAIKYPQQIHRPKTTPQFRILALITFVVLLSFLGIVYWIYHEKVTSSGQEVKFSDVVKEWEKKQPDSTQSPFISGSADSAASIDTLVLEGAAVESVWVRVVIDGSEIKEYNLAPLERIRCEGRQYFELSMDNARGIILNFNGKRIGTLSQIKKPLWNVTVSPTTIERLQKMAGKG